MSLLLHIAAASPKPPLLGAAGRPQPVQTSGSPEPSLLAKASFAWLNPTLSLGSRQPLQPNDLPPVRPRDSTRVVSDALEGNWNSITAAAADTADRNGTVAVLRAMWRTFGGEFAAAGLVKLASDMCQIASPLLLKRIIGLLEAGTGFHAGLRPSVELLLLSSLQAFCLRHYFAQVFRIGLRLRAAVVGVAFRKMLRLSPSARISLSSGEITNIMGSDASRFADLIPYLHALWFAPLQVVAAVFLLWQEIGPNVIPGLAVIALVLNINKRIAGATFRWQQKLLRLRDERARMVRETISGIKVIKLHAWELAFARRVQASRDAEVSAMRVVAWLRAVLSALFTCTPSLVAVAMLGAYTISGHSLQLKTAMTVLSAVNLLRSPLVFLPLVLQSVQEANLSLGRLSRFLNAEEYQPIGSGALDDIGVAIDGGTFEWQAPPPQPDATDADSAVAGPGAGSADAPRAAAADATGMALPSVSPPNQQHLHAHPHPISELVPPPSEAVAAASSAGIDPTHSPAPTAAATATALESGAVHSQVKQHMSAGAAVPERAGAREPFVLRDIELRARPGELVAVVGAVGSGKSSLIAALLGDMPSVDGSVSVRGSIAYTAQTPFILGASVRDNIVFDQPYDEAKYQRVLEACQLLPDLELLPDGDFTIIGDRGVFLSGGQRARVALARAVYADAQVYLFDDPLAACDPRVSAALMEQVIGPRGLLANKLRILTTSNLESLNAADQIHVLRNGEVEESGTYEKLAAADGAFAKLLQLLQEERMQSAPDEVDAADGAPPPHTDARAAAAASHIEPAPTAHATGGAHHAEPHAAALNASTGEALAVPAEKDDGATEEDDDDTRVGRVELRVLWSWVKAAGGMRAASLALIPLLMAELTSLGSQFWLTRWASSPSVAQLPQLTGYAGWALMAALTIVVRSRLVLGLGLAAGARLHDALLARVIRAPLSFFDLTPRGRLLNRFSKELNTVDVSLPSSLQTYGSTLASVATTLAVVCTSSPEFALLLLPIGSAYAALQRYYSASSREIKRIESSARAPVVTHIASSLDGLTTIRAFDASRKFTRQCEAAVDANLRASLTSALINCWLGLRLEMLGAVIAAFAAMLAFARNAPPGPAAAAAVAGGIWSRLGGRFRGSAGVGTAALAVTLAVQVTQTLNWTVRQATEVESHLIAVERLKSYDALQPEPGYTAAQLWEVERTAPSLEAAPAPPPSEGASLLQHAADAEAGRAPMGAGTDTADGTSRGGDAAHDAKPYGDALRPYPPADGSAYAQTGALELRDLRLRYRENLPNVLHGLSVSIQPGEKVGVVGRTGSGKSSLVVALTRLVAPPLRTGGILLDGVDISSVPLHVHRSAVAVIPQEPVLFSGTIRDNLDPLGEHSAEALWAALQRVHLAHAVRSLDDEVAEDGANFSSGQRQLLCIARALLSRCSLVIMDEATSAVDAETDALIQRTVRSAFADATVITIAHRLNTVLDSDKIMVLDKGELVEFGSPRELMSKSRGLFREMVHASSNL